MGGYAFARIPFKGKKNIVFAFILISMMVPFQVFYDTPIYNRVWNGYSRQLYWAFTAKTNLAIWYIYVTVVFLVQYLRALRKLPVLTEPMSTLSFGESCFRYVYLQF